MCKTEKWKKSKNQWRAVWLLERLHLVGGTVHSQSKDELLKDEKAAHKDLIA